jgi:hypothetical protein
MRKICVWFVVLQAVILLLAPVAMAKTHKDNYPVSCDVLWKAVKDTIRNSGQYGIVGIDNTEMSISYVIGGTLGGKRINSVVLNKLPNNTCEMQTQTAYSGLIHNDAGDFKKRVDEALAKQASTPAPDKTAPPATQSEAKPPATGTEQSAVAPADLKPGLTPEEVEKLVGKPKDTVTLKDSVIYIYPAYKVIFEKGRLSEVQYPDAAGK